MKKTSAFPHTLREISIHRQFIYGICALWIMVFHFNTTIPRRGVFIPARIIQETGACGVEVFLLLTGFGLYGALNRNPDVWRFYRRRLARVLAPALVLFFCYDLILCPRFFGMEITPWFLLTWPWEGALWYVSFMLVMYLLYPVLHRWIRPENKKRWIAAVGLIFVLTFSLEFLPLNLSKEVLRVATRIPAFLLGCMLAPAVEENRAIPRWTLPCLLAPAVGLLLAWHMMKRAGYIYALRMAAYLFLAAVVILLLVMLAKLMQRNGLGRRIYNIGVFCGGISLEIYLMFDRVRELLEFVPVVTALSSPVLDLLSAVLTLLLAWLLRRLCECLIGAFSRIRSYNWKIR